MSPGHVVSRGKLSQGHIVCRGTLSSGAHYLPGHIVSRGILSPGRVVSGAHCLGGILSLGRLSPGRVVSGAGCLRGGLSPGHIISGAYCLPGQIVSGADYLGADCLGAPCPSTNGKHRISCRWVLWYKGEEVRARLTARGFEEQEKVASDSPTIDKCNVRLVMAICESKRWVLETSDVK